MTSSEIDPLTCMMVLKALYKKYPHKGIGNSIREREGGSGKISVLVIVRKVGMKHFCRLVKAIPYYP